MLCVDRGHTLVPPYPLAGAYVVMSVYIASMSTCQLVTVLYLAAAAEVVVGGRYPLVLSLNACVTLFTQW